MLAAARSPAIGVGPRPLNAGAILAPMKRPAFIVHSALAHLPPPAMGALRSGFVMGFDSGLVRTAAELGHGEECFIDERYFPAAARGVPLPAAQSMRLFDAIPQFCKDRIPVRTPAHTPARTPARIHITHHEQPAAR